MNNFSPNMLKTYETCSQKYWFKYEENIAVPQKASNFEKGKKIHALANYYLRGDNIDKLEKALTPEEQRIWKQLKNNEYFQKKYVESEYNLSCRIGEYWIGGRLDALVKDSPSPQPSPKRGEGVNYFILDYKTGSIPKNPEYDFQTMVYLLALNASLSSPATGWGEVNINFVYIDLKNNQNHIIELTPEKIAEYEKLIIQICSEIKQAKPIENIQHTKKCDFCEYKKICF